MDAKAYRNVLYNQSAHNISNKISQYIKKLFLQMSDYKGYSRVFLRFHGSLTVEASLSVPVFFIVVFSLFYILRILFDMNCMEVRLADTARNYAIYDTKLATVTNVIKDKTLILWKDNQKIPVCYVSYKEEIPFIGSEFVKLRLYQQMAVSPYKGRTMASDKNKEKSEFVYVTPKGKVYHRDKRCTYLKPRVKSESGKKIEKIRNSSGAIYHSCELCCKGKEAKDFDVVYITTYGNRFHADSSCRGIKKEARRIKLSEAGNMPPCSKCGEK